MRDVTRPDNCEVTTVKSGYSIRAKALGDGDN
jgi:hypothetical protein